MDLPSGISPKTLVNTRSKHSDRTKSSVCLILLYHTVKLPCYDPLQLAVEPYKFEKQMQYLAANFNVISIDQLKQHLQSATPFREKTVIVTFDGGYSDLLYTAKEVLERYEIFAAVFATSANILTGGQLWPDELENLLIANHFTGQLELQIDGQLINLPLLTEHDRFCAYDDLYSILSGRTPSQQNAILDQITQALPLQADELDNHRIMTAPELKKLEQCGLITIGGHTHNYVKLSSLPKRQQMEQISKNKNVLEEVLGHNIEYFSYPFGNDNGYTTETMNILEDSGFSLAFGNSYGSVSITSETNSYELPRIKAGNRNPFAFYKLLEGFFS